VLHRVLLDVEAMPYTSVNGHNLWWILGPWRDASQPFLGPLSAKAAGLLVAGLLALGLLWRAQRTGVRPGLRPLVVLTTALTAGFFFFATHMHENHLFMAVPLSLALAGGSRRWAWLAALVSLAVLLNLALHDPNLVGSPPMTWGGPSPVRDEHLGMTFTWFRLVGTYAGTLLTALFLAGVLREAWRLTPDRNPVPGAPPSSGRCGPPDPRGSC
jgi:hypothetical protein